MIKHRWNCLTTDETWAQTPYTGWSEYANQMVSTIASKSKDPSTKVGAWITDQDVGTLSTGYNGLPRGADDNKLERYERPEKYKWFSHAERNAIFQAAKQGVSTQGGRIYCNLKPCMDCAVAIVQAGITDVLVFDTREPVNDEYLQDQERVIQLFKECEVFYYVRERVLEDIGVQPPQEVI